MCRAAYRAIKLGFDGFSCVSKTKLSQVLEKIAKGTIRAIEKSLIQ